MVERARLESVYTVLSRIEGSNPSLSAIYYRKILKYNNFLPSIELMEQARYIKMIERIDQFPRAALEGLGIRKQGF